MHYAWRKRNLCLSCAYFFYLILGTLGSDVPYPIFQTRAFILLSMFFNLVFVVSGKDMITLSLVIPSLSFLLGVEGWVKALK